MRGYLRFILTYRWAVLALLAVVTGVAFGIVSQATFGTSIGKLFFEENPQYHEYLDRVAEFSNDEVVVIALPAPNPLDPTFLDRLEAMEADLLEVPDFHRIDSVLTAQRVVGTEEELVVESYADLAREHPDRRETYLRELRESDLYGGVLISETTDAIALVAELTQADRKGEEALVFLDGIYEIARSHGFERAEVRLGGIPIQMAETVRQSYKSISQILPLTILLLVIATYVLFRQTTPVFITVFTSLIAMSWTMALAVLWDREVSILLAMVPAIMIIVSFSDIIHLFGAYLLELSLGHEKLEAIYRSGTDVGRACMYTSLTTFVGFISMAFIPTPAFRQLGVVLGFGVAVALLLAMTLCPILFHIMPAPRKIQIAEGQERSWDLLDRLVAWIAHISTRFAVPIVVVTAIAIGVIGYGLSQLYIDANFTKRLDPANEIAVADVYLKDHFAGTNITEFIIDTGEENGIYSPEFLRESKRLIEEIEAIPEVDQVLSFLTLLEEIHLALNPDATAGDLPEERNLVAQYLLLFEMSGGEDLERFISHDRARLRMSIRLNNDDVRVTAAIGEEIEAKAHAIYGSTVTDADSMGMVPLIGHWIGEVVTGQKQGLGFAVTSIAVMMIIALRSLSVGLWSMIPNMLPLGSLAAYLSLAEPFVDSDTLAIMMIAIGIGVDDTIHFMTRLRIETGYGKPIDEAILHTFRFAGRAIIQTTVILCLGFLPFALSDYYSTQIAGTLLPGTLIVALLADLFLVPALVELKLIRYRADSIW